jgi:DNA-binding GntR family transcriptional regulator
VAFTSSQNLLEDIRFPIYDSGQAAGSWEMLREPTLVTESVASDEECARLGLFPGEMVYRVERTRGQGEQLLVENIRLAAALFPNLQKPVPSISDLADSYGLQLGKALESGSVIAASADIAKALDVAEGTLILRSERVVYLRGGRPAEWGIAHYSGRDTLAHLQARLGL